jgi:outer membrane protein assembly factor BamB
VTGWSRRGVLVGAAGAAATLSGCGYAPGKGDVKWQTNGESNVATLIDGSVFRIDREFSMPFDDEETARIFGHAPEDGETTTSIEFDDPIADWSSAGDRLFVGTTGGTVAAVTSGGRSWSVQFESAVSGVAAVQSSVYVTSESSTLASLAATDGSERWTSQLPPRDDGGDVYLGAGPTGVAAAFDVEPNGLIQLYAPDGSLRWEDDRGRTPRGTPQFAAGTVYAQFDGLSAYDAASGELRWTDPDLGPGPPLQFVPDGGTLFAVSSGRLTALAADDGRRRWRFSDESWAERSEDRAEYETDVWANNVRVSPTGDSVYVATKNHGLLQFEAETGALEWHGRRVDASFLYVVTAGMLVHSDAAGLVARYG